MVLSQDIDIDQIPEPEILTDVPPKRGPGRPKGSTNKSSSSGSTSTARRGRPLKSVRETCVAIVGGTNIALSFFSRDDVLDDAESDVLVAALEAEARQSERIMRWMQRAGGVSAHLLLIQAIILIAIPRLTRRGLLPQAPPLTPEQEREIRERFEQTNGQAPANSRQTPYPGATL